MTVSLVIHGHFYQPPRENPWTNIVEREPSAHPFHNWNERINQECYHANGFARIADSYNRVERILNNYTRINFNFGPTLLSWMEHHHPETYARILSADRESARAHGGHGNAIAQGYHHIILPLANERDRRTQARWGLADFRHRFGREAESLWLPETACNAATLDLLIEEGLRYVILSPYQAARVRPLGGEAWQEVAGGEVDPTRAYNYFHSDGGGRSLAVFFYDGQVARSIAFDGLLASSHMLIERLARAAPPGAQLVNVATDGESYGHHFRWGERCLAYALEVEAAAHGLRVTNYGEFLDEHPPAFEVEIKGGPGGEGTAWSCAHGVGRWTRDCGCHAGGREGWNQKWRTPLRDALDLLRDAAAGQFESAAGDLLRDPWEARDRYVELLNRPQASREDFWRRHARRTLDADAQTRALTLLELQRDAMVMYTSCGWFFDDISGLEATQILRYAGRTLERMDELQLEPPRRDFLDALAGAQSNIPELGNGADIFRRTVEASRVGPPRVAAHVAISGLIEKETEASAGESASYLFQKHDYRQRHHGRVTLATGHLTLEEQATGRRFRFALAAMHFGDVDYYCALKFFDTEETFRASTERLWTHFPTASLPVMLRLAQEEFGPDEYGLEDLLSQGRKHLSEIVFSRMVGRFTDAYGSLYEENRRVIETLQAAGFVLPKELRTAAELTFARRLENELRRCHQGAGDYRRAVEIAEEASRLGYRIDRSAIRGIFEDALTRAVLAATTTLSSTENFAAALMLTALGKTLGLEANLERAQEAIYTALQQGAALSVEMRELGLELGLSPRALEHEHPLADEILHTTGAAVT